MSIVLYILIGILGGVFSGFFGVGGGMVIIPAMIFLLGLTQKQAQGTSLLALLLPVGILGVWKYYSEGYVNIALGLWLAVGFVGGTLLGSTIAVRMDDTVLRKVFACFLIFAAINLLFKK